MSSRSNTATFDRVVRRSVPIPAQLKEQLRAWRPTRDAWTWYRARQLQAEYDHRRERYQRLAEEHGIVYRDETVAEQVRKRIAGRGYTPTQRQRGDIHTFACFPTVSWHGHMIPELRELGPLTHFDYASMGISPAVLERGGPPAIALRREILSRLLPAIRRAHAERPIDWIFCYGGGQDTSPSLMRQIAEEIGVPTINMSHDDKQGWAGGILDECRTGSIDITKEFDLFITSARVACEWHMIEGGRPIYLPEAIDALGHAPRDVPIDIPVSFVGVGYGFRRAAVEYLRQRGAPVQTFGAGWPGGGWVDDVIDIACRSQINLGMGGIEYSESLTNVKGRDFWIPALGGGVYLTTFNPDLALHFIVGEEILCFANRDEMLELIRYYLPRPEECREMARRARVRCLREHRWLHRFERVLEVVGVLPEGTAPVAGVR